jgi:NAD(P)H dehydrogenase (quinone)
MSTEVLVLYYSHTGNIEKMAQHIARGVESVDGVTARVRTVPKVSTVAEATEDSIPESGAPYASYDDLVECDGIIFGSPTRFGNMAAPMKYFWDGTGGLWGTGKLINKPAGVFTSTGSMHNGQETTLISMMTPLLHHGCLIVGLPCSESEVLSTKTGGSVYGATHLAGHNADNPLTEEEQRLCFAQGKRMATIAKKLS